MEEEDKEGGSKDVDMAAAAGDVEIILNAAQHLGVRPPKTMDPPQEGHTGKEAQAMCPIRTKSSTNGTCAEAADGISHSGTRA
jgi:hypothetical protein